MEKLKTSDTQEEVKQDWETTWNDKFEVSKEEYLKLQELNNNKTIAIKKEREEAQALKQRLSEFEAKEKEQQEKEMKKKWQFEELLKEKETLISQLQEKASKYDEYLIIKQKETQEKLTNLMSEIPEEVIKDNNDILEDLTDEKKIKFLEKLRPTKKEAFNPEVKKEWKASEDEVAFNTLKSKIEKWEKVSPTERATYLNLLRAKLK